MASTTVEAPIPNGERLCAPSDVRPLIHISNASKIFATTDGQPTWALSGVSLDVAPAEFVCVVGPSGCGKTTLLNLIAGFLQCTDGTIRLNGVEIGDPGPDRGVVFQEYALFAWLTARQNIEFGMRMRGVPRAERRRRATEYLELFGLERSAEHYPHELSGGMRQRIAVARALVNEPQVLLMDEPFAAVDAITRATLQTELLRIWQQLRLAVFFITHNVEEAIFLSQRIVLMSPHPGRVQEIISNDLPHPRDRASREFGSLYSRINACLHSQNTEASL